MGNKRERHQEKSYQDWCQDDAEGMKMLDRALEGASLRERAQVRNVLLSFDVEPGHEFYLLFVAFGQLLVLVKEAPENWRALFDDVHKELKLWSKENFKSLESIQLHAKTSAELIVVLRELLGSMRESKTSSHLTSAAFINLEMNLSSLKSKLGWVEVWSKQCQSELKDIKSIVSKSNSQLSQMSVHVSSHSTQSLSQLNLMSDQLTSLNDESLSQLNRIVNHLDQNETDGQRREWILNFSLGAMGVAIVMLLLNNQSLAGQLRNQELLINDQRKTARWLLQKANRAECLEGIKPADDLQCRQYEL